MGPPSSMDLEADGSSSRPLCEGPSGEGPQIQVVNSSPIEFDLEFASDKGEVVAVPGTRGEKG